MVADDGAARAGRDRLPAVLADPLRRRVHGILADGGERSRSEVAALLGIPRSTAAFHLERLAAAGLLEVASRRPEGRSGPGAGRPTKYYRLADRELADAEPRRYALAGEVMAEAIELAAAGEAPRLALQRAADSAGRRIADGAADLPHALDRAGFAPRAEGEDLVLGVCPFHRLAQARPGVVCELNHALVCGMADALGEASDRVRLDPGAGECCLRVRPPAAARTELPGDFQRTSRE
ncbi:helix-turn-helix transcriptional regulator [Agromyces soli]